MVPPVVTVSTLARLYVQENAVTSSKTKAERRAKGLCQLCGGEPVPGKSMCETCCVKNRAWAARHYLEHRANLAPLREGLSCIRCGESHPACLDFHHRDPKTKLFSVGAATARGYSREKVQAEIEKCDVLCRNCHAKLHWEERNGGKTNSQEEA